MPIKEENILSKNFQISLSALLDKVKSKKQINSDIKVLEQAVNSLRLVATFSKAATKKELNAYINQLTGQLSTLKLKAKIDNKNLKSEINHALTGISFKDINALNIDENKTKLKSKKILADIKSYIEKNPISPNISLKKEKLNNQLTAYLNKNSKIRESEVLLKEADKIRDKISAINDKDSLRNATDSFQLFKSEVQSTGYQAKSTTDKIKSMVSGITKIGSLFGIASLAVNKFKQSISTLKEIDTILTEISKTSELTVSELEEIGNSSFKIASKYGRLASDYLTAVQEMSRAGYKNAESIAELSTVAQGAGDMTAEVANQYIITTDKAYKMNGSIETLTETLDGANNITNNNAVTMTELAEAMSIVGSQAASSQMEVNETTAAVATLIAVTQQGGSEMGNAFKGILMNLQQVTGEIEDGGDVIDEESLTKYEKACNDLGVSLTTVKDGVVSLREPMEIIKELSEAYTKLDETDIKRSNLLSAVGGKYRANALNALLENYDMYSKMLDEYADGIGSMDEEAQKTADSWEGRINSLQNSWDSLVNTITGKTAIKGGVAFLDNIIQGAEKLTDALGAVPVLLTTINTAIVAMNKDYGITQLLNPETKKLDIQGNIFGIDFTSIKAQKKHFEEAEGAIAGWNNKLLQGQTDINDFNESVVQNNAQLKNYLSTCSTDAPASLKGYKAYLNAAGVSTDALRLKTILLNAALTMGISFLVSKGIELLSSVFDDLIETNEEYAEKQDEIREKTKQALSDSSSEYENLKSELEAINSELDETADRMKELANQESLTYTEQAELNKLITANNELKNQKELLENNLKLKERDRAYDAKDVLQTEGSYTYAMLGYEDGEYVITDSAEYDNSVGTYEEQAKKYIELIQNAKTDIENSEKFLSENQDKLITEDYNEELQNIARAKEILDRNKAKASTLISTIQDNLSYLTDDNGEPLEGFEDIYNNYNKLLNNLQSSIDISNFMSVVKNIGTSNGLNIDSIIEKIYREAFYNHGTGESVDLSKINSDLFNDLLESGLSEDVIMSNIQEVQESFDISYDTVLDKYKSKGTDFRHSIDNYIRENPIDFQMIYSYDENFTLLDKYIEAEKKKAENTADYAGDYVINALERAYKEVKAQADSDTLLSFEDAFNASDFADTKEELLELAKSGELTSDVLESTDEYKTLLTQTGLSAEEAKLKILNMLTATEKLSAANNGLDSLTTAFNEWQDKGFVTASTLESLPDVFKDLEGYDLFSQIVGDPGSSESEIQQAFNDIATEYLKTQGTLGKITKENTSSYIANLKDMGIANAEEVVEEYATAKDEFNTLLSEAYDEWTSHLNDDEQALETYLSEIDTKNVELMNAFGEEYSTDYENWLDLLQKKKDAYDTYRAAIEGTLVQTPDEAKDTNKYWAKTDQIINKNLANGLYTEYENQEKAIKELAEEYSAKLASTKFTPATLDFTGSDSSSSSSDNDTSETFDWIETKLNRVSDALDKTKSKANDTYSSWINRNAELANAISQTNEAIDLQSQAYERYIQEANSIELPEDYKRLIEDGAINIESISDETLKDKISEYQTWYEKAQECLNTQQDLKNSLNELNKQKFDNIQSQYSATNAQTEHSITMLEDEISLLEAKGLFANEKYYDGMISYTQKHINDLTKEKAELQEIIKSVAFGEEAWTSMYSEILDIDEQISNLTVDVVEFNNTLRDLNWDIFEYLEESLNCITDETDYLVDLLSNKNLFDENGQITNYGTTSIALHAAAYDVYKQQAQDYYEEVQDLQKQLVNGAGKKALEQYNAMVDAHQEAVLAAEEEKQSILDLIEDGYNAQLDALQKLIDKKKEQLNAEKNLYDYQKSIKEQTDNISSLEKQKLAYEGDTSEEAMSKLQQIKVQLEEAKADLEETEYEQYLSDTENMLDQLAEDYEEWMNARLDNEDALLAEIVSTVSDKGDEINTALNEVAQEYGTFVSDSLNTIFNSDSPFTKSLTGKLNDVSNALNSGLGGVSTSVAGTTTAINDLVNKITGITGTSADNTNAGTNVADNNSDNKSSNVAANSSVNNKPSSNNTNNGNSNNPSTNISTSSTSNNTKTGKALLDSILITKKDYYPKSSLNIETSVVDRLKYNDKDSSFSARATYWSKIFGGAYTGSDSQNTKLLNYLKSNGYKSGTSNAAKGYHWTQEDGEEIIYRTSDGAILTPLGDGDMVFNNESSKRLWEFANNPEAYMQKYNIDQSAITAMMPQPSLNVVMPDFSNIDRKIDSQLNLNTNVGDISVNLELPNITDYKAFRNQLIKDSTFEKAMFTSINHALTGRGTSLDKLKYTQ